MMPIKNTSAVAQHPWPDDTFIQGGGEGLVIRSAERGGNYRTAFVEVSPSGEGFIRGEGETIALAEDAAWKQFQRVVGCPGHDYEARGFTNGAGFCRHCNAFSGKVFTPEQLGLSCKVCGIPTYWSRIGDDFFCEDHAHTAETEALRDERRRQVVAGEANTVTGSVLGDLFESLGHHQDEHAEVEH